jgi:hypothetical protein
MTRRLFSMENALGREFRPKCGTRFVHQRGRSIHGQSRSQGVIYCTSSCARAAAQHRYRQRKKRASS